MQTSQLSRLWSETHAFEPDLKPKASSPIRVVKRQYGFQTFIVANYNSSQICNRHLTQMLPPPHPISPLFPSPEKLIKLLNVCMSLCKDG